MSKKQRAIKRYDYVRIVNPEVVVRWGYNLNKQIVKDTVITKEQKDAIIKLLELFNIHQKNENFYDMIGFEYEPEKNKVYEKILDEIAYGILKSECFGGKERKLFTERRDFLKGVRAFVSERRVVKTGKYEAGQTYQGYFDPYPEYEPAYLSNEKTHVLYRLDVQPTECPEIIRCEESGFWIEKQNVERFYND